jgi:hypothetical protein
MNAECGKSAGERGHFHYVWPGATGANAEGRMMNAESGHRQRLKSKNGTADYGHREQGRRDHGPRDGWKS